MAAPDKQNAKRTQRGAGGARRSSSAKPSEKAATAAEAKNPDNNLPPGWVDGTVVEHDSGTGLADVRVLLRPAAGGPLLLLETNDQGVYTFPKVDPGEYTVELADVLTILDGEPWRPPPGDPGSRPVAVAADKGSSVDPIRLQLALGAVAGFVLDLDTGAGVPAASVVLAPLDGANGAPAVSVMTDVDGRFFIDAVAPGPYVVRLQPVPDGHQLRPPGVNPRQVVVHDGEVQLVSPFLLQSALATSAVQGSVGNAEDASAVPRADGPGEPSPAVQRETGVPDVEEAAARGSDVAARLRWARERGLRAMEEAGGEVADVDWRAMLLPAAHQLREALETLTHDDNVWRALRASTAAPRDALVLQQVFDQDLAALLVFMGYRPPPPPQRLEVELKEALASVLEASPGAAMAGTGRAQQRLSLFLYRLRRVIAEAEAAIPHPPAAEQQLRERVANALREGMRVAVPASLAAGAVGLAFPPAAPAAAAVGLGAAITPAAQELLKQAIQLAGTSLLDKTLADEPATASSKERLAAAWLRTRGALYDLQVALVDLDRNRSPDLVRWVDVLSIDGASSLYGLLQAAVEITPATQSYALQATASRLVELVREARDQVTIPAVRKDASRISQDLAEETRKLEVVMGGWI